MITPASFKETCKDVFGADNCKFTNSIGTSEPYYVHCIVENMEVARLVIYSDDLSTHCRVCTKDRDIVVNYNFTLKHNLKRVRKNMNTTRQKLFKVYSKISSEFPDNNLQEMVGLTIKYLMNVEYVHEYDIQKFYKELFESICHNNPKIYEEFVLDMFEYFASKVKVNRVVAQILSDDELKQLNKKEN